MYAIIICILYFLLLSIIESSIHKFWMSIHQNTIDDNLFLRILNSSEMPWQILCVIYATKLMYLEIENRCTALFKNRFAHVWCNFITQFYLRKVIINLTLENDKMVELFWLHFIRRGKINYIQRPSVASIIMAIPLGTMLKQFVNPQGNWTWNFYL